MSEQNGFEEGEIHRIVDERLEQRNDANQKQFSALRDSILRLEGGMQMQFHGLQKQLCEVLNRLDRLNGHGPR